MNSSNTLILSACLLLGGALTGTGQDTIPTPLGEEQDVRLAVEQWVQPNAEGLLIGQITSVDEGPVGPCDIALVSATDGVLQFSSDEEGKVMIRDVPPGVYALAVRGEDLVATYALHVVDRNIEDLGREPTFTIGAARVDSRKFYGQIVRYIPGAGGSADPLYPFAPEDIRAVVGRVVGSSMSRVQLTDGGLEGCLYTAGVENGDLIPASQSNVFILQDGLEVARAMTDAQGCYRFDEMAPGRYSFIAVGPGGIAATGFELVAGGATTDASKQDSQFKLASAIQPPGFNPPGQLNLQMAPPQGAFNGFQSMGGPEDGLGPPFPLPPGGLMPPPGFGGGFAGGGGPGGGFGGGGSGGGGGGIGGLLGIAGLAAGIAALADDDDDFEVPTPMTPAVPAP